MKRSDEPIKHLGGEYYIRHVRNEDLNDLCRLVAERDIYERFFLPPFISPDVVMNRYIASFAYNRVVAVCQNEVVGWAGITPREPPCSHVAGIGVMVRSDHTSRGVATKLLTSLISSADNSMGLRRLELYVLESNARAIRLYESLGFIREGLFADAALFRGEFVNLVPMARINTIGLNAI